MLTQTKKLQYVYDDDDFVDPAEAFSVESSGQVVDSTSVTGDKDTQAEHQVYRYRGDESVLTQEARSPSTTLQIFYW